MRIALAICVAACGAPAEPATVTVAPLATMPTPPPSERVVETSVALVADNAVAAPEVLAPGKVTLVHFFASWCMPCKKSLPELDAIYKNHSGRVAVIAYGEDDDEGDMRSFVSKLGVVYTVLWDGAKAKAGRWRPNTMPTTFVVDKHGSTRFTHAGYHDDESDTIEAEVKTLLAEPVRP